MKKVLIIFVCFLGGCFITIGIASANSLDNSWTKKDTAYQTAFLLIHAVDYLQTKEIARSSHYHERNIILGSHPEQNKIDIYFLSTAVLHTGIAYFLPAKYRRWWQSAFIGLQAGVVGHNINAGVSIKF